jgi:hypothetical protein
MAYGPRSRPGATRRDVAAPLICAAIVAATPGTPQPLTGAWAIGESIGQRPLRHGRLAADVPTDGSAMPHPTTGGDPAGRHALHLQTIRRALEALAQELALHPHQGAPLLLLDRPRLCALCVAPRARARLPLDPTQEAVRDLLRETRTVVRSVTSGPLRQLYTLAQTGSPPLGPADYHRLTAWCAEWPRHRASLAAADHSPLLLEAGDTALALLWDWLRYEAPAPRARGVWAPVADDLPSWPPDRAYVARRDTRAGEPATARTAERWLLDWPATIRTTVRTLADDGRLLGGVDLPDGWRYWELDPWLRNLCLPTPPTHDWDFVLPGFLATLAERVLGTATAPVSITLAWHGARSPLAAPGSPLPAVR